MNKEETISFILPTLNECNNIPLIYSELVSVVKSLNLNYEIIFVDDNSTDGSIEKIKELSILDHNVKYLIMSKRFGDQACLMAGLDNCEGDAAVILDADLQHPTKYIVDMYESWKDGNDVVIMKREIEGHRNITKKFFEILFYKILNWLSDEKIYFRFSGFSLMDKKVINQLKSFKEYEPFLRGIISLVGFKHSVLNYVEGERKNGETKYNLFRQFSLALVGITSFSNRPLFLSLYFGIVAVLMTFLFATYILINKLFFAGYMIEGWASVMLIIIFFGGIQLITIGILGIYVGKNFIETKKRPRYIVNEFGGF